MQAWQQGNPFDEKLFANRIWLSTVDYLSLKRVGARRVLPKEHGVDTPSAAPCLLAAMAGRNPFELS